VPTVRLSEALFQPFEGVNQCPLKHAIDDVAVRCPRCGRFVLFLPLVFEGPLRIRYRIHGVVILLATIMTLVLFRYTHVVWPLYWFLLLGIVHMYATVFTRGAALASAGWFLGAASLVSLASAVLPSHPNLTGVVGGAIEAALRVLPVLAWLVLTGWMLLIGRRAITSIKVAASYFLAAATLTLGFWGVWVFYLENDLVDSAVYHLAVAVALLLPVACILFLFTLPGRHRRVWRPWLLSLGALALVALSANLILIAPLVRVADFLLGRFFPRLVGVRPLSGISTGWLGGHQWLNLVTSAMLVIALALVAVKSWQEASGLEAARANQSDIGPREQPSRPGPAGTESAPVVLAGEVVAAESSATAGTVARLEPTSGSIPLPENLAERAFVEAEFGGRYTGEIFYLIAKNILDTVWRAFHAMLPVVAFSLLSMLMVLSLGKLGEYVRHGPFSGAIGLWGMVLSVLVGVVVLCGIAYDFSPSSGRGPRGLRLRGEVVPDGAEPERPRRQPRPALPLVVIAAGFLLTSVSYLVISLLSWALLPLISPGDWDLRSLFTGDLFFVNLAISTLAFVLLASLYALGLTIRGNQPRATPVSGRFVSIPAAFIFVAVSVTSVGFGVLPIKSTLTFATSDSSRYDQQVQQLRSRVPQAVQTSCGSDYLLVPGQTASLDCRDGSGTDVSYHAFSDATALDTVYRQTVSARGVSLGLAGSGVCAGQWPAEGTYTRPDGSMGRAACYLDRRGAWLIWTDSGALGIAYRGDGQQQLIASAWLAGNLALGNAT
jgi:hypothetical protein